MSLTTIQRVAMVNAQSGDWTLADAMELACPARGEFQGYELLYGIRQGGRLQFFVYGVWGGSEDDEDQEVYDTTVYRVANLNGDVVYAQDIGIDDDLPPLFDPFNCYLAATAEQTVSEWRKTLEKPTQTKLIPEPA